MKVKWNLCLFVLGLGVSAQLVHADLLCAGGKVVWTQDRQNVGCVFPEWGPPQQSQCKPHPVIEPHLGGNCWVCIRPDLEPLVLDSAGWNQLRVGGSFDSSDTASFNCLAIPAQPIDHVLEAPVNVDTDTGHLDGGGCSAGCSSAKWTGWLNRDRPSGSGDFESLRDFQKAGKACPHPLAIECRTLAGVPMPHGAGYVCKPDTGGICDNRKLPQGKRCEDYRVRFCCG